MHRAGLESIADNAVDVPLYTLREAARYVHLPYQFLFDSNGPQRDQDSISFRRLADMFVWASTFQFLNEWGRISESAHVADLCDAFAKDFRKAEIPSVSFGDSPIDQKIESFIKRFAPVDESERLGKWFALSLARVEVADETPVRIYPFTRDPAEESIRIIVLDPLVRFGCPMIAGKGITTESVFERFQAGDSIADLAVDYDLTTPEVEEAIRYESLFSDLSRFSKS